MENPEYASTGESDHPKVWSILPWYVTGTLGADEHALVDRHLSTCLVCNRELLNLSALRGAVVERTSEPQCESALQRLHARLDDQERGESVLFPWAAAAVLVIVAGLAAVTSFNMGLLESTNTANDYTTLGARSISAEKIESATARIVFEQDITEIQLRKLLLDADAELIDGPTPRGTYTIAIPQARSSEQLQTAVQSLRESKRVIFVEPIVAIGQARASN